MGSAIAVLSAQVDDMTKALDRAQGGCDRVGLIPGRADRAGRGCGAKDRTAAGIDA